MCKICPNCGSIAEFSYYYGRVVCTRCVWQSEKISNEEATKKYSTYPNLKLKEKGNKKKNLVMI